MVVRTISFFLQNINSYFAKSLILGHGISALNHQKCCFPNALNWGQKYHFGKGKEGILEYIPHPILHVPYESEIVRTGSEEIEPGLKVFHGIAIYHIVYLPVKYKIDI